MKRLSIALAAMCLTISGPAQAAADYIGFERAVDLFQPMSWNEKVEFVAGSWRKKCRKDFGCVYTMRMKSEAVIYSLTEERPAKSGYPSFRQWCVEGVDEQRMRCDDEK